MLSPNDRMLESALRQLPQFPRVLEDLSALVNFARRRAIGGVQALER